MYNVRVVDNMENTVTSPKIVLRGTIINVCMYNHKCILLRK